MQLSTISKAIAGFLATTLVAFMVSKGYVPDPAFNDALNAVILGVLGFALTYFAPKNK